MTSSDVSRFFASVDIWSCVPEALQAVPEPAGQTKACDFLVHSKPQRHIRSQSLNVVMWLDE